MNYDIRQLCIAFPEIHSRYYADTNGVVYTSIAAETQKIMIDGKRISTRTFKNNNLCKLNRTDKQIMKLPYADNYFMLYDGTILQRLKTNIRDTNQVTVNLVCLTSRKQFYVSRLIAGLFVSPVDGKEVHHLDQDRINNKASNLEVLDFDEHRGKGEFYHTHTDMRFNDYPEREYTQARGNGRPLTRG